MKQMKGLGYSERERFLRKHEAVIVRAEERITAPFGMRIRAGEHGAAIDTSDGLWCIFPRYVAWGGGLPDGVEVVGRFESGKQIDSLNGL
jgi:hypothetical protein